MKKKAAKNEKTKGRNYGGGEDGIRDPTRGEMRVISINVERSYLRKHREVNANYSERSARIPNSIIERANGASGTDYRKFDLKLQRCRNNRKWPGSMSAEDRVRACAKRQGKDHRLWRNCVESISAAVLDLSDRGWNQTSWRHDVRVPR